MRTWKSRDFKKYYEINDYAEGGQYLTTNHFEISEQQLCNCDRQAVMGIRLIGDDDNKVKAEHFGTFN